MSELGDAIERMEAWLNEEPGSSFATIDDYRAVLRAARLWLQLMEVFGESWLNGETVMRIQEEQK